MRTISPIFVAFSEKLNFKNEKKKIQCLSPTLFAKNEDIDWSQAMNYVKAAEQQFPIAQKDLTEIMSKPGVKPTYNFASIVNHSPTLQRYVNYKSLNSNGTFYIHYHKLIFLPRKFGSQTFFDQ